MFLLRPPSNEFVRQVVDSQRDEPLMYADVGFTRDSKLPEGYFEYHFKAELGRGEDDFLRAKESIVKLRMLNLGWLSVVHAPTKIAEGEPVATLARQFGVYTLNVARIVYVEDQHEHRFGFGYGTLPVYPVYGEERFTVTRDPETNRVEFEIYSFAKPASIITKIGWQFVRRVQRRFGPAANAAMRVR